jgi:hypothetical protein
MRTELGDGVELTYEDVFGYQVEEEDEIGEESEFGDERNLETRGIWIRRCIWIPG